MSDQVDRDGADKYYEAHFKNTVEYKTGFDEGYAQGCADTWQKAIEAQCLVCRGGRPGYDPTPYLDCEGIWCHKSIGLAEESWWPCSSHGLRETAQEQQAHE